MRILTVVLALALAVVAVRWRKEAASTQELRAEIARLNAISAAPPAVEPPKAAADPAPAPPASSTRVEERTIVKQDTATLDALVKLADEKQTRLATAQKSLGDAENRIHELEEKSAAAEAEIRKLAAAETDLKDRLETANRVNAALEAEVKGRSERVVRIETSNRELLSRQEENARNLARLRKAAEEIEDLSRRRDLHLNNLQRRYREVTDQYRSLAVRGAELPVGVDLSRIQSAIALAEDDLRQLQALGAQAARLQKELAAARR